MRRPRLSGRGGGGTAAVHRRFGFTPAASLGLTSVYSDAGDAFMALELTTGYSAGARELSSIPPNLRTCER